MYLEYLHRAFSPATVERLFGAVPQLLATAGGFRTSLSHHLYSPAGRDLIRPFIDAFFASPLPGLFEQRYGVRADLVLNFTNIRHIVAGNAEHVDWHLDANFIGVRAPYLVAWTPSTAVGEAEPGLEFLTGGQMTDQLTQNIWAHRGRTGQSLTLSTEELAAAAGPLPAADCPRLSPGDSAIFDQFVFHRSQPIEASATGRISVEFRICSLEHPPESLKETGAVFCFRRDGAIGLHQIASGRESPFPARG